jgi:hypothetical protein
MANTATAQPCREVCYARGEPLAGSAGAATDWIGIAWPKPRWHHDAALLSEGLPGELRDIEGAAKQRGRKLAVRVFQRYAQPATDSTELVLWGRAGGLWVPDVPLAQAASWILRHLGGEGVPGAEPLENELFVCTDGKHDACCARLGRPLYDALRSAIQRTEAPVRVSECSHLGGHRFAANVLALPEGVLYGRVEAGEAERLLAAVQRGEVMAPRFRGRLGQGELMQVAEAAVRERSGARGALEVTGVREAPDWTRVEVRLADGRRMWVRCERRIYRGPASCGDESESEQTRWIGAELGEG